MNHQVRLAIDARVLGDGILQDCFTAYVEMLAHVVLHAPKPIGIVQLAGASNRPIAMLRRHAHDLGQAGILKKSNGTPPAWSLAKSPSEVTLEDVFRCAVASCDKGRRGAGGHLPPVANEEVDALLMQALQAVDEHLYKHLRTYSLDRLRASGAVPFPMRNCHHAQPFAEID